MIKKLFAFILAFCICFSASAMLPTVWAQAAETVVQLDKSSYDGSDIRAYLTFENLSADCVMYAGIYDIDGNIKRINRYTLQADWIESATIRIPATDITDSDTVKIFFFDAENGVKPLCRYISFDVIESRSKLRGVIVGTNRYGGYAPNYVCFSILDTYGNAEWEGRESETVYMTVSDGINVDDYFGISADVYYNEVSGGKYEITDIEPDGYTETLTLEISDIDESSDDDTIYYYPSKESTKTLQCKLSSYAMMYFNYNYVSSVDEIIRNNSGMLDTCRDLEITLIENTGDSYYDMVIGKEYNYDIADDVEYDMIATKNGKTITFDFEDEDTGRYIYGAGGEVIDLSDIEAGDVIAYLSSNGGTNAMYYEWIEVVNLGKNFVSGTVDEVNSDLVYINEKEYENISGYRFNIGDTGNFYLTKNGKIFCYEQTQEAVETMSCTLDVNRGHGTFEAYLTDSDTDAENFVGNVDNYLYNSSSDSYVLTQSVDFSGYRNNYKYDAYDNLKFVFTPFEGESYSDSDVVEAICRYYGGDEYEFECTGYYTMDNGNLIVTLPFNTADEYVYYAFVTISVNGIEQEIDVLWNPEGYYVEDESVLCETWDEVLDMLNNVSSDKFYQLRCIDSSAITLASSLTIPANVMISLENCPDFTVADGGVLSLLEDKTLKTASQLRLPCGEFVVNSGGTVMSNYTGATNDKVLSTTICAPKIIFESGSKLNISDECALQFYTVYSSGDSTVNTLTFESGSTFNISGNIFTDMFDVINLNAVFNLKGESAFCANEINIAGQINVSQSDDAYLQFDGSVNVEENGSIIVGTSNDWRDSALEIIGSLTNNGNIEIRGASIAEIYSIGMENYNMGTILVEDECTLQIVGTNIINSGVIYGDGTLNAMLGSEYGDYDGGTEYVEVENDGYWDNELGEWVYALSEYSRSKYTHDPSKTVDATLYLSKVINSDGGRCDVEVVEEDLPQV